MALLSLIFGLAGCAGASSLPTPEAPGQPAASSSLPAGFLAADGVHVATERVYEGDCSPAGSRGGCHTITLRPDGTSRNFLFDAVIDGTYTIEGQTVTLMGADPSMRESLTLSADGNTLGTLPAKTAP